VLNKYRTSIQSQTRRNASQTLTESSQLNWSVQFGTCPRVPDNANRYRVTGQLRTSIGAVACEESSFHAKYLAEFIFGPGKGVPTLSLYIE